MRLIATLQDEDQGKRLSNYLKSQNIDNILDISTSQNWGDAGYGVTTYTIWTIEEEDLAKALQIAHDFTANSSDPRFDQEAKKGPLPLISDRQHISDKQHTNDLYEVSPEALDHSSPNSQSQASDRNPSLTKLKRSRKMLEPLGIISSYILMLCIFLFLLSQMTAPSPSREEAAAFTNESLPLQPLYYSHIEKELMFDYPHAYGVVDQLVAQINETNEGQQHIKDFPLLIDQFRSTPFWQGYYSRIVAFFQDKQADWTIEAPLFEKIRQGESWRLISPILLHSDIFHLLFNMIWLVVLGKQLENRMGWWRYLFFIFLTAALTNTAQYLMTGPNFVGFSGVICAMITFVYMRQKKYPWEGYLLQSATLNFALFFLFLILLLQMTSFYTEISYNYSIAPHIANTAHMVGLFLGLLLGNLNFFSVKH